MDKYQGWANYPTWAVALWIDNDQYMYNEAVGTAEQMVFMESLPDYRVADWLHEWVDFMREETIPDIGNNMFSDLLGWAIEMVDWHELATHYIDTAKENATYE